MGEPLRVEDHEGELRALRAEVASLRDLVESLLAEEKSAAPAFHVPPQRLQKAAQRRRDLVKVLVDPDWNKAEAARRLGVTRVTVWRQMKHYGIALDEPSRETSAKPNKSKPTLQTRPQRVSASTTFDPSID